MTVLEAVAPRFRNVPLYTSSAGQDAVDLAAAAGLVLDQWQVDVLLDAMALGPDGLWAAMRVGLIVPRQNGKGSILEALELFHLFAVPTTELITHTAHRFDTCLDHFRRIRKLIEDTPDLVALVKDNGRGIGDTPSGIKDSNGKESIELRDGSRLNFKAREKGSGRGFSGDLVVLDEAFWLKDLSGLIPTMSSRLNPQVWYTSSAPLPRVESDRLRRLVREGRALAGGSEMAAGRRPLTYFEWSVPVGSDVEDHDNLRDANPSTEVGRITPEFSYEVERQDLTEEEFARERFGMFPDEDEAPRWEVIPEAQWNAAKSLEGPDAGWSIAPASLGIEMPPDGGLVSIGSAAACRDGGVAVDLVAQVPADELVDLIVTLTADTEHPVSHVVIDPSARAGALILDLEEAGVTITPCKYADLKAATGDFYDDITAAEPQIHHRCRPALDESVSKATKRTAGDTWLIDRRTGADSSPLGAVVLARWGHLQPVEEPKKYRAGGFR